MQTWAVPPHFKSLSQTLIFQLPVDFLKPNDSPGTNTSLWVIHRGLHTALMTPLSTHGVKPETEAQQERVLQPQTHHLTRSQPDVAGISDFTLTHPQHVHKLSALFIPK